MPKSPFARMYSDLLDLDIEALKHTFPTLNVPQEEIDLCAAEWSRDNGDLERLNADELATWRSCYARALSEVVEEERTALVEWTLKDLRHTDREVAAPAEESPLLGQATVSLSDDPSLANRHWWARAYGLLGKVIRTDVEADAVEAILDGDLTRARSIAEELQTT